MKKLQISDFRISNLRISNLRISNLRISNLRISNLQLSNLHIKDFFNDKALQILLGPLNKNKPITVQALGVCSVLAIIVNLKVALVLGISVTIIMAFSNVIMSLLHNTIPTRIRLIVQLIVVAALVTIVSEFLKANAYNVGAKLSVFIGFIIINSILLERLEVFAVNNKPWESFLDGLGNGIGYSILLIIVAFFRELLGSGSLFGFKIIPQSFYNAGYMDNGLMLMPPMALLILACIIWVQRLRNKDLQEK